MSLQGAMAYAMLKAHSKMNTNTTSNTAPNRSGTGKEAMWLWMKDHPHKSAPEIAAGTKRPLQTVRADIARLLKDKLVKKAQSIRFQLPTFVYEACGTYPEPKDLAKVERMQAISATRRAQREAGTLPPPSPRKVRKPAVSVPPPPEAPEYDPSAKRSRGPAIKPPGPAARPTIQELDLEGYSIRELRELRDRINDMLK